MIVWSNIKYKTGNVILIIILCTSLALTTLVSARPVKKNAPDKNGKSINIDIYWDDRCKRVVKHIDWGTLEPGSSSTKTIYIKNKSTIPLILRVHSLNFQPLEAEECLTLVWDKEGFILEAGGIIEATFTLSTSNSASNVTKFSFDIIIEGTA